MTAIESPVPDDNATAVTAVTAAAGPPANSDSAAAAARDSELLNIASMVPCVLLGAHKALVLAPRSCALAPLSYIAACIVSSAFHAHCYLYSAADSPENLKSLSHSRFLRADLSAQLVTCAFTVAHTSFGANGLAFVLACAVASSAVDLRRHRAAAFAINGVCIVVSSGPQPIEVYAMWAATFSLFYATFVRPNRWTHAAFHLGIDVALHSVWKRLIC